MARVGVQDQDTILRKRNPTGKDNSSDLEEEDLDDQEVELAQIEERCQQIKEIQKLKNMNPNAYKNADLPKLNIYPDLSHLPGKVENGPDDKTVIQESTDATHNASEMNRHRYHFSPTCYVCVIAIIVLCCVFVPQLANLNDYLFQPEHNGHSNNFASEAEFDANLSSIKKTFNNQNEYFWKTLKTLGSIHLQNVQNRRVQRPLVLTLVSTKSNQRSLDCIAEKIGGVFTCGIPHVFRSHNFTESRNPKSKLDTAVNDALLTNEKVAVLYRLDAFSYKVASLFFKYCDSEETPFPDAVFVFTVALDKDVGFLGNNRKIVEREVERYLMNEAWKDGIPTKTSALLMRVDEVPIIVFEEDDQLIKNQCNI